MFSQYNIVQDMNNFLKYNSKGIFSKNLNVGYKIRSNQPWIFFECEERPELSFQMHDLEMGEEESAYWHMSAQREEQIKFKGFVSPFYSRGIGSQRGYLESPENPHYLGVILRKGRLVEKRTIEDMANGPFANTIMAIATKFSEIDKKKDKNKRI